MDSPCNDCAQKRRLCSRIQSAVSEANRYFFIESSIALLVSFVLNLFVIGVFGNSLHEVTNQEAFDLCQKEKSIYSDVFNVNGK